MEYDLELEELDGSVTASWNLVSSSPGSRAKRCLLTSDACLRLGAVSAEGGGWCSVGGYCPVTDVPMGSKRIQVTNRTGRASMTISSSKWAVKRGSFKYMGVCVADTRDGRQSAIGWVGDMVVRRGTDGACTFDFSPPAPLQQRQAAPAPRPRPAQRARQSPKHRVPQQLPALSLGGGGGGGGGSGGRGGGVVGGISASTPLVDVASRLSQSGDAGRAQARADIRDAALLLYNPSAAAVGGLLAQISAQSSASACAYMNTGAYTAAAAAAAAASASADEFAEAVVPTTTSEAAAATPSSAAAPPAASSSGQTQATSSGSVLQAKELATPQLQLAQEVPRAVATADHKRRALAAINSRRSSVQTDLGTPAAGTPAAGTPAAAVAAGGGAGTPEGAGGLAGLAEIAGLAATPARATAPLELELR